MQVVLNPLTLAQNHGFSSRELNRIRAIIQAESSKIPDVDEDLSVEGMFNGVPAHRPQKRSQSQAS